MLEVVAETYNDLTPLDRIATRLPLDGGTVGRGDDNTVVLCDPTQAVSRRHLQFARAANGEYEVANISSANHVLVNDRNLVPGSRCVVRDQDRIHIGSYVLKIREVGNDSADEPGAEPVPAAAHAPMHALPASGSIADDFLGDILGDTAHVGSSATLLGGVSDADPDEVLDSTCSGPRCDDPMPAMNAHGIELAALSGKRDELVSGPPAERAVDSLLADPLTERHRNRLSEGCTDPLRMFGDGGASVLSGLGLLDDEAPVGLDASHHINHRAELNTPFAMPAAQVAGPATPVAAPRHRPAAVPAPESIIPDDDFALLADDRATIPPDMDAEPGRVSDLSDHPAPSRKAELDLSDYAVHGASTRRANMQTWSDAPADAMDQPHARPTASASPAPVHATRTQREMLPTTDASYPSPAPCEAAVAPRPHPVSTPACTAERENASSDAELFRALLEGLGLPSLPDRDHLDPEFMRLLGRLLRAGTQGTIDLISARATVKREVRANVTVIAPERNNPLKFSPDSEVGLMYLLGRPYPGFMEPVEAMREAYADLYAHQMGIVSGMRSALGHVLERFDPETIATSAQRNGLIEGLLAVGRKARLWDAYGRYFQNTREQAEDRFQDFFGAVFLDAYDEVAGPRQGRTVRRKTEDD